MYTFTTHCVHFLICSFMQRIKCTLWFTNVHLYTWLTIIRGRSDKYLAYKRKTNILEKWRFISQHSLLSARYTWLCDAPNHLTRLKNTFSVGLQSRPSVAAITSSFDSNFCPASDFFKFGNKKKLHGTKSGEYGGWGSSS